METVIKTKKGYIKGIEEGSCMVFKNIPYAKPPVGELRWKRPVEMDPWEDVLDCTKFGNITVQDLPGEAEASDTAFHSAELWYTFGTLGRCWRPMQEHDFTLSKNMVDAWTSFMKTGHPGNGWKPCSGDNRYVQVFS